MSTESGSEAPVVERMRFDDIEVTHTYCYNSPRNYPVVTTVCCGSDPTGPEVDPSEPTTCPMCADLEPETAPTCACWW